MTLYALGDIEPRIDPEAFVHPDCTIIGNVVIGAGSTIWPQAVLRGDQSRIVIGERTSVQDGAVLHCTRELETVGVVDEAVEDGVGVSGIAYQLMPALDGKLARDDGGTPAVTVVEYLQHVVTSCGIERLEPPVVENEQIGASERAQQALVAAVAASKCEVCEEPGNALVEHRAIVAAGLVTKGRSKPALADTSRSQDEQIGVLLDPLALRELAELAAVEAARRLVVDILDAGLLAQFCIAQACCKTLVMAQRDFVFEQQREPFGVAKRTGFALRFDVDKRFCHAVKTKSVKGIESGMGEHVGFS